VSAVAIRTEVLMGTLVTIHAVKDEADEAIDRAFEWFREIEARCTRFDEGSELMRLCARVGVAVPASAILFQAVQFALTVAADTGGAFDPTIGDLMIARGFNQEHRTGHLVPARAVTAAASYRDVSVDPDRQTITLHRPLTLDLGAVAKGLAVDAAARELAPFEDFAIDAGGDLYMGGSNPQRAPWSVGIRHPRLDGQLFDSLRVSNRAVCTSGDYERPAHIIDPRSGQTASSLASVTVVAPTAMVADALATAAFVMGPADGMALLERHGVEGLIVTSDLERIETAGLRH
jgi:thiamine biosynthesis lipoprotein